MIPYRLPQKQSLVAVRILVQNQDDVANVNAIQNQFAMCSLSNCSLSNCSLSNCSLSNCSLSSYGTGQPEPASYDPLPPNNFDGDLGWLEDAWQLLQIAPPEAKHAASLTQFASVGLRKDETFDPDAIDSAFRKGLTRAVETAHDVLRWKAKFRGQQSKSCWNVDMVGGSYGFDYLARAEGAVQGLFVHDAEECLYFHTYMDGRNEPLDATKQYQIHFSADQLPQIQPGGFWSITMYRADYQFAENAVDRYAIKDRTPGLQFNDDGSLDLYIQNTPPIGHQSNWLPSATDGIFRLNFRVYMPGEKLLDRTTVENFLPPVMPV